MAHEKFIPDFAAREDKVPLLYAGAPGFLTKDASDARSRLIDSLHGDEFQRDASPLMKEHIAQLPFNVDYMVKAHLGVMFA